MTKAEKSPIEKLSTNELSSIKTVIAVMSGKGGVGKSTVTSLLAIISARKGNKVGVLDADITGPSIPKMFGTKDKPDNSEFGIYPVKTSKLGIEIMSLNLLLAKEDDPVIWRGPLIAGAVKQFWTDVIWGDLDYLFIDLPPGTGDVPLTVMQQIPLDGLIVVSSPQDLALMVVKKAVKMAEKLSVPILGLVENMSYAVCPECGEKIQLFGKDKGQEAAQKMGIPFLGSLPIDPVMTQLCDTGKIEDYENESIEKITSFKFNREGNE